MNFNQPVLNGGWFWPLHKWSDPPNLVGPPPMIELGLTNMGSQHHVRQLDYPLPLHHASYFDSDFTANGKIGLSQRRRTLKAEMTSGMRDVLIVTHWGLACFGITRGKALHASNSPNAGRAGRITFPIPTGSGFFT